MKHTKEDFERLYLCIEEERGINDRKWIYFVWPIRSNTKHNQ